MERSQPLHAAPLNAAPPAKLEHRTASGLHGPRRSVRAALSAAADGASGGGGGGGGDSDYNMWDNLGIFPDEGSARGVGGSGGSGGGGVGAVAISLLHIVLVGVGLVFLVVIVVAYRSRCVTAM
jgi:hypothetical protein